MLLFFYAIMLSLTAATCVLSAAESCDSTTANHSEACLHRHIYFLMTHHQILNIEETD